MFEIVNLVVIYLIPIYNKLFSDPGQDSRCSQEGENIKEKESTQLKEVQKENLEQEINKVLEASATGKKNICSKFIFSLDKVIFNSYADIYLLCHFQKSNT